MAQAIWRARQSASAPGEQLDALREVADAVGGRLREVFWTVNAGEAIALVEFSDDAGDVRGLLQAPFESMERRHRTAAAGRLGNDQRHVFLGCSAAVVQNALGTFHGKRQNFGGVAIVDL